MCRAHGLSEGVRGPRAWTSPRRTPLYYPDAVTLTADAEARDVLDGIDRTTPGASVKDSLARLDLAPEGFRLLFEAQWIHRPAGLPDRAADAGAAAYRPAGLPDRAADAGAAAYRPVRTPGELAAWTLAWSGGDADEAALFRPELLDDPATTIVAGHAFDGRILGGAVLTTSPRVTGVSNLFTADGVPASAAWSGVLTVADPALPLVGYESGDDLDAALAAGFEAIGPLRVWLDA
ncbi:hypothetical protein ACFVQ4_02490 [Streptomyces laurentii]|uniref:hypothetical protein n=1 Tax=Streptomyces laurentii TaxID=39478 RepID=UPI0036AD54ED